VSWGTVISIRPFFSVHSSLPLRELTTEVTLRSGLTERVVVSGAWGHVVRDVEHRHGFYLGGCSGTAVNDGQKLLRDGRSAYRQQGQRQYGEKKKSSHLPEVVCR
jgi:hypothetical protein